MVYGSPKQMIDAVKVELIKLLSRLNAQITQSFAVGQIQNHNSSTIISAQESTI